jgi:hypothetical protein
VSLLADVTPVPGTGDEPAAPPDATWRLEAGFRDPQVHAQRALRVLTLGEQPLVLVEPLLNEAGDLIGFTVDATDFDPVEVADAFSLIAEGLRASIGDGTL